MLWFRHAIYKHTGDTGPGPKSITAVEIGSIPSDFSFHSPPIYHIFQALHLKKQGPLTDIVCTLALSPKMKANENKLVTDELQRT